MSPGGTAQTQTARRSPLRLRGRLLLTAAIWHDLTMDVHTTTAKGPSRSLERMLVLCLFSSVADRSVCGSAIPSWNTQLLQVALVVCFVLLASFLPRERFEPAGLSLRRRLAFCLSSCTSCRSPSQFRPTLLCLFNTTATLRPRLRLLGSRKGCCVPGQGQLLVLVLCCEGVGVWQAGRRLCSSRLFSRECFNRSAEGRGRLSTPQSVHLFLERW